MSCSCRRQALLPFFNTKELCIANERVLFVDVKFIKPILQHAHLYVELYDLAISSGIYSLMVHSYFRAISIETDIYGSYAKYISAVLLCFQIAKFLSLLSCWVDGSWQKGYRLQNLNGYSIRWTEDNTNVALFSTILLHFPGSVETPLVRYLENDSTNSGIFYG